MDYYLSVLQAICISGTYLQQYSASADGAYMLVTLTVLILVTLTVLILVTLTILILKGVYYKTSLN